MKRFYCILVLLLLIAVPALAAEVTPTPLPVEVVPNLNWGSVISEIMSAVLKIISMVVVTLIGYFGEKYVVPWLRQKKLMELAKTLVQAAEAELGRFNGSIKWEQVMEWFTVRGYDINDDKVKQAASSAWLELNNKMIELGLKDAPTPEPVTPDPFTGAGQPIRADYSENP